MDQCASHQHLYCQPTGQVLRQGCRSQESEGRQAEAPQCRRYRTMHTHMSDRLRFIACISNVYHRAHEPTKVPRYVTPSYLHSSQRTSFTACKFVVRMHHSSIHQCTQIAVCPPIRAHATTPQNSTAAPHTESRATYTEVHTIVAASAVLAPD